MLTRTETMENGMNQHNINVLTFVLGIFKLELSENGCG